MSNINLNDLWKMFNEETKKTKVVSPNKQSDSPKNRAYVKEEFEMRVGLDQTYGPPTVEDYKVVQYVTYVYYTMYPMKAGEVYPSNWKEGAVYGYQKIRESRAKLRGSEIKDGMKGLRLHVVVGVLLYCILIKEHIAIPTPIFLKYLNTALQRYVTKEDRKEIDIKTFERYRTESKPKGVGIKPFLRKTLPGCYVDIEPEDLIEFTGFSLLSLKRPEVYRAKRIAMRGKQGFPDTEPPSYIAISALYIVAMQNNLQVNHNDFGISEYKLKQSVRVLLNHRTNSNSLNKDLQGFVLPSTPKSKKSASMK